MCERIEKMNRTCFKCHQTYYRKEESYDLCDTCMPLIKLTCKSCRHWANDSFCNVGAEKTYDAAYLGVRASGPASCKLFEKKVEKKKTTCNDCIHFNEKDRFRKGHCALHPEWSPIRDVCECGEHKKEGSMSDSKCPHCGAKAVNDRQYECCTWRTGNPFNKRGYLCYENEIKTKDARIDELERANEVCLEECKQRKDWQIRAVKRFDKLHCGKCFTDETDYSCETSKLTRLARGLSETKEAGGK